MVIARGLGLARLVVGDLRLADSMSAARDGALDCESASAEAGKGADTHVAMEREIGKERTERRSIGFSGGDVDMETSTEDCLCEAPHDVLKDTGAGTNATEPHTRAQSIANTRGDMFSVVFWLRIGWNDDRNQRKRPKMSFKASRYGCFNQAVGGEAPPPVRKKKPANKTGPSAHRPIEFPQKGMALRQYISYCSLNHVHIL